jgi:hypothetical protein
MALHLIKLAVGIESLAHLRSVHAERAATYGLGTSFTETRMIPRRSAELLDGGSLYWVIKGSTTARQSILDLDVQDDPEGRAFCRIHLGEIVPVLGQPRRPFQGWRYLKPEDAPNDADSQNGAEEIPAKMAAELRALGLL